jgi:hypothetical protein
MKIVSAALVSCVLVAAPAWAEEDAYRSTVSGTVKIEIVPPKAAQDRAQAPRKLTIELVAPPRPALDDVVTREERLRRCDERWSKKVAKRRKKDAGYQTYVDERAAFPAQAAPPEALLTRLEYRRCMYACLDINQPACPGDLPPEESSTPPQDK